MRVINEVHGDTECPFCSRSLVGKDIKQTFIEQGKTEQEAIRSASYYGWTPENTWESVGSLNRFLGEKNLMADMAMHITHWMYLPEKP